VEYINGAEVARSVTGEEVTKWPVEEIYEIGVGGSFIGADGKEYTYSHRRVVPATYYNIEGLTYLGTMADESVIAVDRTYVPLGTKLYVKNDKYDFGVRIASDVGSAIKGWEIDIWIDDSNPQLESFAYIGYHWDMEIYYID
jgi:3D (Asp-Asp-Asp) domain-containing protein